MLKEKLNLPNFIYFIIDIFERETIGQHFPWFDKIDFRSTNEIHFRSNSKNLKAKDVDSQNIS